MKTTLVCFFAVTTNGSLYCVSADGPTVEKIAQREDVEAPTRSVGEKLANPRGETEGLPTLVGLTFQIGICLYSPTGGRQAPDDIPEQLWGESTSRLVALFTEESVARECLRSSPRQAFDERWVDETRNVVEAIGFDHTVFLFASDDTYGIPEHVAQITYA